MPATGTANARFPEPPISGTSRRRVRALPGSPSAALARLALGLALALPAAPVPGFAEEPPLTVSGYTEKVTVTSTRLADRAVDAREIPASTTVVTSADIAASGARTVQEALSRIAGVVLYDQIGNAVQTTLDLRGFTGSGITVLLDGARINDPRNNAALLETIAVDSIDRIEITRGAAAATVGGGSAAGVVNIVTRTGRRGDRPTAEAAQGTYDMGRYVLGFSGATGAAPHGAATSAASPSAGEPDGGQGGSVGSAEGRAPRGGPGAEGSTGGATTGSGIGFDWLASASRDRTDGFRENADAKLDRYAASFGVTLSPRSRLSLTLHGADDEIGAPGALTLAEWQDDPGRSPFNALDSSDVTYRQATAAWRGTDLGPFSFAGNLSYLTRDSDSLTTGRAAAAGFGGFRLDATVRTLSAAAQSSVILRAGRTEHLLTFGGEGGNGTSQADACGTAAGNLTRCDPTSFSNSSNETHRSDAALFVQDSIRLGGNVTLEAGGRWDRSRFRYREDVPDPLNDDEKTFSETSWKGGLAWNPSLAAGLYASYGESFLPPTVEDLFAFPTFGSNPGLEPSDVRSYEVGFRGSAARAASFSFLRRGEYSLALYRSDLTNEIVFDPASSLGPFGANVNAGESRREGIETTASASVLPWLAASLTYSRIRATFESGANEGDDVPLVPRDRLGASFDVVAPLGLRGRLDVLRSGSQVLSNDDANGQPRLDAYTVVGARVTWRPREAFAPRGREEGASSAPTVWSTLEVFVEARNLFDEEYATRGIYAFDFAPTNPTNRIFVTPAPPRTWAAGLHASF